MDKEKDRDYEKEAKEKLDKWLKEVGLDGDVYYKENKEEEK